MLGPHFTCAWPTLSRPAGKDNPTGPRTLTDQQKARSVMYELVGHSSFDMTLYLKDCCTSGRNFFSMRA